MKALISVATAFVALALPTQAAAQDDQDSSAAQALVERHAPVVMVKSQTGPCDGDGEAFAPMSVDVVLDNDDVTLRQAGTGDPIVVRGPGAADLFERGEGFFLDFNGLSLDPGCVYEENYNSYTEGVDPVVYAHVVQQADEPDQLAVQYWLYWYYNDWNNTHESDWEFIQVVFDASSVEEALAKDPREVGFAQHEGGERASWDDDKLQRNGDRPIVYSSAGSHASYFDSGVYLGRRGTEGLGCDTTRGPSTPIDPRAVLLPSSVDAANEEFAWLAFDGRWGERHSGPFDGPTGPTSKERWTEPIDWQDSLRDRSVTVPGSDVNSETILDRFCTVVGFASNQVRAAQVSPTRLILVGTAAVLAGWFLARRTDWSRRPVVPLRQARSTGQMIRGAFASYWQSKGGMLAVAALYLPAAGIVGLIGATRSFSAGQVAAAGLTGVLFVVSSAVISAFWHLASQRGRAIIEGFPLVVRRLPSFVSTLVLATGIVILLTITVVGIPFAIRQFIRYQFIGPVTITEELSGTAALKRSSELVQGRWWRTAVLVAVFAGFAALLNTVLQLGLLVALGGVPLWVYLMVAFLATGLVVPLVATPQVLLYGTAAFEHANERADIADRDDVDDDVELVDQPV